MFIKRINNSSLEKNEENSNVQKTLPKFTLVMISDHLNYSWRLGFYSGENCAFDTLYNSLENAPIYPWMYIIPLDKFRVDLKTNQIIFDIKDNYGTATTKINDDEDDDEIDYEESDE